MIVPHLGGPLTEDAAKAAVAIGENIVEEQPGPVADAMQKVVASAKTAEVVAEAKDLLGRSKKAAGGDAKRP